jgi:hypothetical protein
MRDDLCNAIAEPEPDICQPGNTALIFDCIMHEGGNSLIFIGTVFQCDGGRTE